MAKSNSFILKEMIADRGIYGEAADPRVENLLQELSLADADASARWGKIMEIWKTCDSGLPVHYGVLPDGLPQTGELAIVALGYQLEPDGTMRPELIGRLQVVLNSAKKYPQAFIVCTGGGTAAEKKGVTEAGQMAEWLIGNGVCPGRVIVEDRSVTTAQNAIYTLGILAERYPQVRKLAIVSSDYHIATGTVLFEAESILRQEKAGEERIRVVSNAAWKTSSENLPATFQAGALIELTGDTDTAFAFYHETYDIHELPPLQGSTMGEKRMEEGRKTGVACRDDWKTKPMPDQHETFVLDRSFSDAEMDALRCGNIPQAMEDKWFWYMEGPTLWAHRSWTGYCIYRIDFKEDGHHVVTVNRDPEQYKYTGIEEDAESLNKLLDWWAQTPYDHYHEWLSETHDALKKAGKGQEKNEA